MKRQNVSNILYLHFCIPWYTMPLDVQACLPEIVFAMELLGTSIASLLVLELTPET